MFNAFVFSVLAQAPLILGGLLAMMTNSLIPFSFTRGGLPTGLWAAGGFAMSLLQQ
jgi:hypothetical protein